MRDPRLWYAPWIFEGQHASMSGLATSGTLTHWFRDNFAPGLERKEGTIALAAEAEASPPGARGLVLLPYFSGERTPIHDPHAKGVLFGLNLTHTRGDIYRALLEGIAYGTNHIFETYSDAGALAARVLAVGGGTKNKVWSQATSDVSGLPQAICARTIGASYGDAFLAALGSATCGARISAHGTRWPRRSCRTSSEVYRRQYGSTEASTSRPKISCARSRDERHQRASRGQVVGHHGNHVKGFNRFSASDYQTGIGALVKALDGSDVKLTHLPGHLVPTEFPSTLKALSAYDVVVLSDIGADSLLLHPDTFIRGQRTPNRLKLISEWVSGGGGFLMAGGYLVFRESTGRRATAARRSKPSCLCGSCRWMTGWKCRRVLCRWSKARHGIRCLRASEARGRISLASTRSRQNPTQRCC